jgi:hypothetical protein
MTSRNGIAHYKLGKKLQFSKDDLEKYKQSKRSKGTDEVEKEADATTRRLAFTRRRKA